MAEHKDQTRVVTEIATGMIERILAIVAESVFAGPTSAVLDVRAARAKLAADPNAAMQAMQEAGGSPDDLIAAARQIERK